jgi:hypothetical protein
MIEKLKAEVEEKSKKIKTQQHQNNSSIDPVTIEKIVLEARENAMRDSNEVNFFNLVQIIFLRPSSKNRRKKNYEKCCRIKKFKLN